MSYGEDDAECRARPSRFISNGYLFGGISEHASIAQNFDTTYSTERTQTSLTTPRDARKSRLCIKSSVALTGLMSKAWHRRHEHDGNGEGVARIRACTY